MVFSTYRRSLTRARIREPRLTAALWYHGQPVHHLPGRHGLAVLEGAAREWNRTGYETQIERPACRADAGKGTVRRWDLGRATKEIVP
jgi:hypothetical protein